MVFHSNRDGNFEIYVMDADGLMPTRLTDYPGSDQFPDWSPNGRQIVFRRDLDIHVLELATGEVRRLTNALPLNQMAAWAPTGRELVFMSARDGSVGFQDGRRRRQPDQPDTEGPRGLDHRVAEPRAVLVDERTPDLLHVVPAIDGR